MMMEGWIYLGVSVLGVLGCMIGLATCRGRYKKQRRKLLDRIEQE